MALQSSFQGLISSIKSRYQRRNTYPRHSTPSQAKLRHTSAQLFRKPFSLSKARSIIEYLKSNNLCASKTKITSEESSAATYVNHVSIEPTEGKNHLQEVSSPGPLKSRMKSSIFQKSESESPELASGDKDFSPSVELNRHTDIRNVKTNVAHHDSAHDTHPAKGQEIVSSAPNPQSLEPNVAHHDSAHDTHPAKGQGTVSSAPTPQRTPQLAHASQNID
ncbi:hypothetical protein OCU04_003100 [Sclerotinia nivalis]|uniref:Uncharacterized protein n=1 Tax=Sclerotinia nivalis TaxID=352851 RepID=A0A9X0AUZ9_9HELO|nr:hypothetical protein OCU04_003100 [Sclerotinia nivalis]